MRVLLVVLVTVGLTAGDRCFRECAQRQSQVRLDSQEVRINHLTAKIQSIEDEFESKLSRGSGNHAILSALTKKLEAVGGARACPEGQFSCGGNSDFCVNNLQVCDGEDDCYNGHDEDDNTCSNPAPAGSRYSGSPVRDACTNRQPYSLSVVITDTERPDYFQPRVRVKASILTRSKTAYSDSTANLPTYGYYDYATRQLFLAPPESDRLGMILDFNTGEEGVVNGYITRESTLERCALFVLHSD